MPFAYKDFSVFQQHRLKQFELDGLLLQEAALHQTLFILTFRSRIDRHTTTDAKRRDIRVRVDYDRANRDTENAFITGPQEPDRTRVSTARKAFEFANDLHRAYLRSARDRTTWKQRAHQFRQARVWSQCRFNCRRHLTNTLLTFRLE